MNRLESMQSIIHHVLVAVLSVVFISAGSSKIMSLENKTDKKLQDFMIKLVFVSLFLICFCSRCESKKIRVIDKESDFVRMELIKKIKLLENDSVKIGNARFAKIDADTNLYVIDWSSSNLKVFSKNGNLVRIIGKAGKGPNELSSPMYFCINGNEVWISEFDNDAFKVLTKKAVTDVTALTFFEIKLNLK